MLALVAEEILCQTERDDVEDLLGHRHAVGEIEPEALELVGLVTRADAERQAAVTQRVRSRDVGEQTRRVVERQHDHCGAEPNALGNRGAVRDQLQR
jgi:hypothetical protein